MGTLWMRSAAISDVHAVLDGFLAAGGTTLDTAAVYGSEAIVGRWIASQNVRDEVVVVGKGGHPSPNGVPRLTPDHVHADVLQSLDQLRSSILDVFLLHRDDVSIPASELVDVLADQVDAGLVRAVGVSNWTTERIEAANSYARARSRAPIVASSPNLALATQNCEQYKGALSISDRPDDLAWHERTQLPVLAWSAQARGFFTGRSNPDAAGDPELARVYYNDANWERKRRARALGRGQGKTAAQVALAWTLHQRFPCAAIIGPTTAREAAEAFESTDVSLTAADLAWLNLAR
jgi:aryl-alcohol dehydrogenase-like predicted oxidoreductase